MSANVFVLEFKNSKSTVHLAGRDLWSPQDMAETELAWFPLSSLESWQCHCGPNSTTPSNPNYFSKSPPLRIIFQNLGFIFLRHSDHSRDSVSTPWGAGHSSWLGPHAHHGGLSGKGGLCRLSLACVSLAALFQPGYQLHHGEIKHPLSQSIP